MDKIVEAIPKFLRATQVWGGNLGALFDSLPQKIQNIDIGDHPFKKWWSSLMEWKSVVGLSVGGLLSLVTNGIFAYHMFKNKRNSGSPSQAQPSATAPPVEQIALLDQQQMYRGTRRGRAPLYLRQ